MRECTGDFREGISIHAEDTEVLYGEFVLLRTPRESDVEMVYSWDRDPDLAAWNGRPPISLSLKAARRDYLARWKDISIKTFIIESEERSVGMATLYAFRRGSCELGIKIGSEGQRGRGLASETVRLLVEYAVYTLGVDSVRGSTLEHNYRMQRVFEKCGFQRAGEGSMLNRYDNRSYSELFYEYRRRG